ncbi:hypothetical protein Tco_0265370 [Tanacetum coccineum]
MERRVLRLVLCLWVVHGSMEEVGCLRCLVAPYPLSPHFPFPPPVVESEVHRMRFPLRVVLPWLSFLGLWNGIAGKELELEAVVDDLVDEDNDSKVEEVYNETATYMVSTGFNVNKASKGETGGGNKSLYELWKVGYCIIHMKNGQKSEQNT